MTLEYILELAAELDDAIQHAHASVAFIKAKPLADELERFIVQDFAPNVRADLVKIRADIRRMCTNIGAMYYKEIWVDDYPKLKQIVASYLPDLEAAATTLKPQPTSPTQTYSHDIFISYASEDECIARSVVNYLKAAGYSTWFDKDNLFGGEEWAPAISKAIRGSSMVMLLFSTRSVQKRGFVQRELKLALEEASNIPPNQVYIMPVRLDDCERPDPIERYHVLDLHESDGPEKLIASVENGIGKAAYKVLPDIRKQLVDSLRKSIDIAAL